MGKKYTSDRISLLFFEIPRRGILTPAPYFDFLKQIFFVSKITFTKGMKSIFQKAVTSQILLLKGKNDWKLEGLARQRERP